MNLNISKPQVLPEWLPVNLRTASFAEDMVSFTSNFPCGNGQTFNRMGECHYSFCARLGEQPHTYRFFLRIDGNQPGREMRLRVTDFHANDPACLDNENAVFISYDNENWFPLPEGAVRLATEEEINPLLPQGSYAVEYTVKPERFPCWLATPLPYTENRFASFLERMAREPAVCVQSICQSPLGLDTPYLVAGGDAKAGKTRVFVMGGQHPSETGGILAVEGMIDAILGSSALRSNVVLHAVPIVCMDGWLLGRSNENCGTLAGSNLNRAWAGVDIYQNWRSELQPEIVSVSQEIRNIHPDIVIDCHNGRGWKELRLQESQPDSEQVRLQRTRDALDASGQTCLLKSPRKLRGVSSFEIIEQGLAEAAFTFENIMLPGFSPQQMRKAGADLLTCYLEAASVKPGK